jgi:hypothetical protein
MSEPDATCPTADEAYISSIPLEAAAKPAGKYRGGQPKRIDYYLDRQMVGRRTYNHNGDLAMECSFHNGKRHGWAYRWDVPGKLLSATHYENDVEHGTAYQWADDGSLLGSYTMEHGTGTDLWWEVWDGAVNLAEAYQMLEGLRHGFEWWFWPGDRGRLSTEKHWHNGLQHGIERDWNYKGRLARGYPRYWIQDERVTKWQYVRGAVKDPTLPAFRTEDNTSSRDFPPEVQESLAGPPGSNELQITKDFNLVLMQV